MKMIRYLLPLSGIAMTLWLQSCLSGKQTPASSSALDSLGTELTEAIKDVDGKIGIAVITPDNDTLTINNTADYQLMSVFKLHQAIASAHQLDMEGRDLDTVITINRTSLDPETWSPMLKEHADEALIELSVREMMEYTLQNSDNNVSNVMFDRILPVGETNDFIHNATGINGFELKHTEGDMRRYHALCDENRSTPLACALLIKMVMTDSLISAQKQNEIRRILTECQTGKDRIVAPLNDIPGIIVAHKTGSGYRRDNGRLAAHNDVGYIILPDGRTYSLAILVRDYNGSEREASQIMAKISKIVYDFITRQ